jgi:NAD+ kinase
MKGVVRSAILFVNLHKEHADTVAGEIRAELENRGVAVTVFAFEGRPGSPPRGKWDIAFSLGGDGTVLYAARTLAASDTPILPLHLGTFGFLIGVESHQWLSVYEQWLNQTMRLSLRCMLELSVNRPSFIEDEASTKDADSVVYKNICLNDIVVSAQGIAKLIRLRVKTEFAPGEFADLGYYRSDGLIIATPTGSTAYSMAAGGPIVDPEMEAQIVSPICPFTMTNRPLVLPSRQTLLVGVDREQRSGVLLTVDGQDTLELEPGDTVIIHQFPHFARLITAGRSAYYSALKRKLSWNNVSEGDGHA